MDGKRKKNFLLKKGSFGLLELSWKLRREKIKFIYSK
jgi:hypothetical protein